jgi:hypothetical protein
LKPQIISSIRTTINGRVPLLTASFGMFAEYAHPVAFTYRSVYWDACTSNPSDPAIFVPICNPMFFYTKTAGDKFIVRMTASPLDVYHLRKAATLFEEPLN